MARRSLWPREHGAYAQLAAPLVAALLVRSPSLAAGLLAIAACCAFAANEPLLVLLGHRGPRMRRTHGRAAARRVMAMAGIAIAAGATGLLLARHATLAVAGAASIGAIALIALAIVRREHSLAGELVAAIALPGAAAPVAVAAGLAPGVAVSLWLGWAVGFAASVVVVHRVIARHRKPAARIDRVLVAALASTLAFTLASSLVVAAPLVLGAFALVNAPPPATRLRLIGVALVAASLAATVLAVATS